MDLSATIPTGGAGYPWEPLVIRTTTFTNPPYPTPRVCNKKLLTPLPRGAKKSTLPSQKVRYFKKVIFATINFFICYNYTYNYY